MVRKQFCRLLLVLVLAKQHVQAHHTQKNMLTLLDLQSTFMVIFLWMRQHRRGAWNDIVWNNQHHGVE